MANNIFVLVRLTVESNDPLADSNPTVIEDAVTGVAEALTHYHNEYGFTHNDDPADETTFKACYAVAFNADGALKREFDAALEEVEND